MRRTKVRCSLRGEQAYPTPEWAESRPTIEVIGTNTEYVNWMGWSVLFGSKKLLWGLKVQSAVAMDTATGKIRLMTNINVAAPPVPVIPEAAC